MRAIFVILLSFFLNAWAFSQTQIPKTFQAKVVAIKDGDTFKVLYNNTEITIRLNHIDCPEKSQPFGKTQNGKHLNFALEKG